MLWRLQQGYISMTQESSSACISALEAFPAFQDNLEMILHEFVLENVETELLRKWKNQS